MRSTGRALSITHFAYAKCAPSGGPPVNANVGPKIQRSNVRVLMPPVIGSRRALGLLCARRAPLSLVGVRCVVPIAVKRAISALDSSSGASRWTPRGSCARRARGLALPLIGGRASLAGGVVANQRLRSSRQRRSRAVGGLCDIALAVNRGPNQALNRTPAGVAASSQCFVGAG